MVQQPGNRLTTTDALTYLREVKSRFSHDKHIYDTFLEIMKDFKAQKCVFDSFCNYIQQLLKLREPFRPLRDLA